MNRTAANFAPVTRSGLVACVGWAALAGGLAFGQAGQGATPVPSSPGSGDFRTEMQPPLTPQAAQANRDMLEERSRNNLHPDQPLRLRGIELDGNDLRMGTPALAKSDQQVTFVDQDELYARTLALHAEGAHFDAPPRAVSRSPRIEALPEPRPVGGRPVRRATAPASDSWKPLALWSGLLLALVALLMGWPRLWARLGRWVEA